MNKIKFSIVIILECAWLVIISLCFGLKTVEGIVTFIIGFWIIAIALLILIKRIDKKRTFKNLNINSYLEGDAKADEILDKLEWTNVNTSHFVAFRFNCTNSEDFDWIVKYISATGKYLNNDRNNPYAEMGIFIGYYMYKCFKTNGQYPVNEIYKMPINE